MSLDRRLASLAVAAATIAGALVLGVATPAFAADTATPSTFANTETSQPVTINTPNAVEYNALGVVVDLDGPAGSFAGTGVTEDTTANTLTATFNVDPNGLPAGPGAYTFNAYLVSKGALPPNDSAPVTITGIQPTLGGSAAVKPGNSVPLTITGTAPGEFSNGEAVTFDDGEGQPVAGMTLTGATVTSTSISGTLNTTSATPTGDATIIVTDTAGTTAACANCVSVDNGPGAVTNLAATKVTSTAAKLTWTAPTGTPTPTGYDVFVSTTASPTSTDSGITVTQSGTDPTATVTGLTEGTKYYVSVAAKSASGDGVASDLSFFSANPSSITFGEAPASLAYGTMLLLSGTLMQGSGPSATGIASANVVIYARVSGQKAVVLTTAQTNSSGQFSYTFRPKRSAVYAAHYAGSAGTSTAAGTASATSQAQTNTVVPVVVLTGTAKHSNQWILLKVKVTPLEAHRSVVIYNDASGTAKRFAKIKLSAHSKGRLLEKHLKPGKYKLIAKIKAHPGNAAGQSGLLTVNKP